MDSKDTAIREARALRKAAAKKAKEDAYLRRKAEKIAFASAKAEYDARPEIIARRAEKKRASDACDAARARATQKRHNQIVERAQQQIAHNTALYINEGSVSGRGAIGYYKTLAFPEAVRTSATMALEQLDIYDAQNAVGFRTKSAAGQEERIQREL